jgi:hypothetical protein
MTASMSEVAAKYTLPLSPVHKRAAAQAAAASTPKSKLPVLEALAPIYAKIDATKKTAYQKTVLKLLCQVMPKCGAQGRFDFDTRFREGGCRPMELLQRQ